VHVMSMSGTCNACNVNGLHSVVPGCSLKPIRAVNKHALPNHKYRSIFDHHVSCHQTGERLCYAIVAKLASEWPPVSSVCICDMQGKTHDSSQARQAFSRISVPSNQTICPLCSAATGVSSMRAASPGMPTVAST
jgi:hypothetical protein